MFRTNENLLNGHGRWPLVICLLRARLNNVNIFAANGITNFDHRFAICFVINGCTTALDTETSANMQICDWHLVNWIELFELRHSYPAIKLASSGCEFPWTITTSDDGKDSIVLDLSLFTGRKLPNLSNGKDKTIRFDKISSSMDIGMTDENQKLNRKMRKMNSGDSDAMSDNIDGHRFRVRREYVHQKGILSLFRLFLFLRFSMR